MGAIFAKTYYKCDNRVHSFFFSFFFATSSFHCSGETIFRWSWNKRKHYHCINKRWGSDFGLSVINLTSNQKGKNTNVDSDKHHISVWSEFLLKLGLVKLFTYTLSISEDSNFEVRESKAIFRLPLNMVSNSSLNCKIDLFSTSKI